MRERSVGRLGSQRGGAPWGWIVGIGCGVILLGCIVFAIVLKPYMEQGMQMVETMTRCSENLQNIGTALQRYRDEHDGQYPRTLDDLVPKYLVDKSVLKCPTDSAVQREVSYLYTQPAAGSLPTTPVVKCELHNFAGQRIHIVLQVDGKVVPTDEKGVPMDRERRSRER